VDIRRALRTHAQVLQLVIRTSATAAALAFWEGLHKEDDKKELEQGAEALMKTALQFHPQTQGEDAGVVLLQ